MADGGPIDKSKIIVDITGLREMLEGFSPDTPSPALVAKMLETYQGYERCDLADKMEQEIRKRNGQGMFADGFPQPLTADEDQKIRNIVDTMLFHTTEDTVRAQIKSEFNRYLETPEPQSQASKDPKDRMNYGQYIGKARALLTTLDTGGGISPEEVTFLKGFAKRAVGVTGEQRILMVPQEFCHLKDKPGCASPVAMQWDLTQNGIPLTNRFDTLGQSLNDHEYLLSDIKRNARMQGRDAENVKLPKFELPPTEKAMLNYVTKAEWGVAANPVLSYMIGNGPAASLMRDTGMAATIDFPTGLISNQPLLNVANAKNGLESLQINQIPNIPHPRLLFFGPMGPMISPEFPSNDTYRMTISRETYNAVLSPVTDFPLVHLKMGSRNAQILEPNFRDDSDKDNPVCLCMMTDAQAKTVLPRLDALKIPYQTESGLTYLSLPADILKRQDLKPVLARIKEFLPIDRPDGNDVVMHSRDALTKDQSQQLAEAIVLLPKKDISLTRETFIILKPAIYNAEILPVLGRIEHRQIAERYSDTIRTAVSDAIRQLIAPVKVPEQEVAPPPRLKTSAAR